MRQTDRRKMNTLYHVFVYTATNLKWRDNSQRSSPRSQRPSLLPKQRGKICKNDSSSSSSSADEPELLIAAATGLTRECASVRTPCIQTQLQDQVKNEDPCTSGVRYVGCLASVLQQASVRGTCGPVVLLSWLQDAYSEAEVYAANCPNAAVASSLRLDACQQQLAACGFIILQAHVDQSRGSSALCSGNVQLFIACVNRETGKCTNSTQVDRFRQTELDQLSCDLSTAAPATKPSPPATTRTAPVFPTTPPPPSPATSRPAVPGVFTTAAAFTSPSPPSASASPPSAPASPQFSSAKSTISTPGLATAATSLLSSSSSSAAKTITAGTSTTSPTPALSTLITTGRSASIVDENPCTVDRMRESGMFHAHPNDRSKFWQCTPWGRAYLFNCPPGTHWRQAYLTCVMR